MHISEFIEQVCLSSQGKQDSLYPNFSVLNKIKIYLGFGDMF